MLSDHYRSFQLPITEPKPVKKHGAMYEWKKSCVLCNSMMGVSIVAMPWCFQQAGLIFATLLLLISYKISSVTCKMLLRCRRVLNVSASYDAVAEAVFGPYLRSLVQLCLSTMLFGLIVAYQIAIRSMLAKVLDIEMRGSSSQPSRRPIEALKELVNRSSSSSSSSSFQELSVQDNSLSREHHEQHRWVRIDELGLVLLTGLICFPLSLVRTIDDLQSVSTCAVGLYGFLSLFVASHSWRSLLHFQAMVKRVRLWRWRGVVTAFPIFVLGLTCHPWLLSTLDTDSVKINQEAYENVLDRSIAMSSVMYLLTGALGYVAFSGKVITGDVFSILDNHRSTRLVELIFMATCILSVPLLIHPCRTVITSALGEKRVINLVRTGGIAVSNKEEAHIVTAVILVFSTTIALIMPNIDRILQLVGAISSSMVSLTFPATFSLFIELYPQISNGAVIWDRKFVTVMALNLTLIVIGSAMMCIPVLNCFM